jgi:hypothetical protein
MDDLIARLRNGAMSTARASRMLADDKSARNQAAGDVDACYMGVKPEETDEWRAANQIERLCEENGALRLRLAEVSAIMESDIQLGHIINPGPKRLQILDDAAALLRSSAFLTGSSRE